MLVFPEELCVDNARVWAMKTRLRGGHIWDNSGGVYPYSQLPLTFEIESDAAPGTAIQITHNNKTIFSFTDGIFLDSDGKCFVDLSLTLQGMHNPNDDTFYIPNNIITIECGENTETFYIYCTWYMTFITVMGREWNFISELISRILSGMSLYDSENRTISRGFLFRNWGSLIYPDSALYNEMDDASYKTAIQETYTAIRANAVRQSFEDVAMAFVGEIPEVYSWNAVYGQQYGTEGIIYCPTKPSLTVAWTALWWRYQDLLNYLPTGTYTMDPNTTTYFYIDSTLEDDIDADNYGYYKIQTSNTGYPSGRKMWDYYPLGVVTSDSGQITNIEDYTINTEDSTIFMHNTSQEFCAVLEFSSNYSDSLINAMIAALRCVKNASSELLLSFVGRTGYFRI
jgi:hypothetical protein